MNIFDAIWSNITQITQIITTIVLIIVLIWQGQDRKVIGAKFKIAEARIVDITRIKNNTSKRNLPEEEALKLKGTFQINFMIMNIGDRNGTIRFNEVHVNSSGINFKLHETTRPDIYERMLQTKDIARKGLTFHIPKGIWFNKIGNLIIKAEYFDYKRSFEPLSFKIPLTTALRYS